MNQKAYLSAAAVTRAGRDLRDALADPVRRELATTRLASAAERSIAQFDETTALAFQEAGVEAAGEQPVGTDDLLAAALSQLEVANTLLAASQAIGEPDTTADAAVEATTEATGTASLDQSLRRLDQTMVLLRDQDLPPVQRFQADAVGASTTVAEAVAAFGKQFGTTLDAVAAGAARVIGTTVTGIRDDGPDVLTKAWQWANEQLQLDKIGGKLARLGMRALRAALDALLRVFPSERLRAVRADVARLVAEMDDRPAGTVMVGAMLGTQDATAAATAALARKDLDAHRLDSGTVKLADLVGRSDKELQLWDTIGGAIGYARTVTAVIRVAIPHLAVLMVAAHLIVVGAVVLIGRARVGDADEIVTGATG